MKDLIEVLNKVNKIANSSQAILIASLVRRSGLSEPEMSIAKTVANMAVGKWLAIEASERIKAEVAALQSHLETLAYIPPEEE